MAFWVRKRQALAQVCELHDGTVSTGSAAGLLAAGRGLGPPEGEVEAMDELVAWRGVTRERTV